MLLNICTLQLYQLGQRNLSKYVIKNICLSINRALFSVYHFVF
jgi:hypothetical protein